MSGSMTLLSMTSARMKVLHVRQPLPSSANKIFRTNLAPERELTEQGPVCQLPTLWRIKKTTQSDIAQQTNLELHA